MNEKDYSIGEFAKQTGLSVRTLHYYDEKGLLTPRKDPDSGHRIYMEDDIKKLHKIMVFKYLGYRLDEIKKIVHTPSFDVSLMESLLLQQKKLEEEKEKIETALSSIRRTIALLEEEGEIDSDILISLIAGMQTEDDQREWFKKIVKEENVEKLNKLFNLSEREKIEFEKESLVIYKEIKRLYGKPANDEEVMKLVERLITLILDALEMETFEQCIELFNGVHMIEMTEDEAQDMEEYFIVLEEELDRMVPSPLTGEEEEWVEKVMEYYMEYIGTSSDEKTHGGKYGNNK